MKREMTMGWWSNIVDTCSGLVNKWNDNNLFGEKEVHESDRQNAAQHATVKQVPANDHPLGVQICQEGYGSCQILAAIDEVSRKKGGVGYLLDLVKINKDGTYDVTLYDKEGKPFTEHVNLKEIHYFQNSFAKNSPAQVINLKSNAEVQHSLNADAPKLVQVLELAYMQALESHKDTMPVPEHAALLKSDKATYLSGKDVKEETLGHAQILTACFSKLKELKIGGFTLVANHQYSMSFNPQTKEVTLRNPWETNKSLTMPLGDLLKLKPDVGIVESRDFEQKLAVPAASPADYDKHNALLAVSHIVKNVQDERIYRQFSHPENEMKIRFIQSQLQIIGLLPKDGYKNGVFDDVTAEALQRFQHQQFGGAPYSKENMVIDHATDKRLYEAVKEFWDKKIKESQASPSDHSVPQSLASHSKPQSRGV